MTSAHGRCRTGFRGSTRVFALALLGSLLVQAAWILVVPPFRGLDEHDHAFKAAAVARGDWQPTHEISAQGWGEFVRVPPDVVEAAQPVCEALPYTTDDNCIAGPAAADGLSLVASSAARYNPVFYFVIGTPARLFTGSQSLYAMRATAALLCSLLLALAAVAAVGSSRTSLLPTAVLLAATPTFMYSTTVAAPNGVELAAATLCWVALMGLSRPGAALEPTALTLMFAAGAVPLVTVRTLGPLWLALIVVAIAVMTPPDRLIEVGRRRTTRLVGALVAAAGLAATAWTLAAGTNDPGTSEATETFGSPTVVELMKNVLLWFFQAVAAFPARDELAPAGLYALAFLAWWILAAAGFRCMVRREQLALWLVVTLSLAVPLGTTLLTYARLGSIWQGRYGYPFAMGAILLCGLALDRARATRLTSWPTLGAGAILFVLLQLIGQLHVLAAQSKSSPMGRAEGWLVPHPGLIVTLTALGGLLLAVGLWRPAVDVP